MSTFSRAQNDYMAPPEGVDPHPWSEDLWAVLEGAGMCEEQIKHAVDMFDAALAADRMRVITHDDLFQMATLCSQFDQTSATFWNNSVGENEVVNGSSFQDTLTRAINVFRNQNMTDEADAIGDYLYDTVGLDDTAYNAACEVLGRLGHRYVLAGTVLAEGEDGPDLAEDAVAVDQRQVEWDGAKRTMGEHLFLMTGERDRYRALYEQALPRLTRMERRITELMGEGESRGRVPEATQGESCATSPKAPKPRG